MLIASVVGLTGAQAMFLLRENRIASAILEIGSIVLLSIPEFLWGLLFILIFGVLLGVLPFMGRISPEFQRPVITHFLLIDTLLIGRSDMTLDALKHMLLPALALGLAFAPAITRVLFSSLLDVYQEDYIQQARFRGFSEWAILRRHAFPNAIVPTLNLMGVQFGFLFGGTLLIEVIYSYPGMGNLMVDAVRNADLPIVQTVGMTYAFVVVAITIVVDAASLVLNPKLRR
jgi:ABC-type dipeptide/oligopeptide/nickel transport system permease component